MLKVSQVAINCFKNNRGCRTLLNLNKFSTSAPIAETKNVQSTAFESSEERLAKPWRSQNINAHNSMVAAAFAALESDDSKVLNAIKTPITDDKLSKANSIDELLSVSEGSGVSRRHALKVVSILANWTSNDKVRLSDFEADPRFVKLCRTLTMGTRVNKTIISQNEDLSTVLSVTADDEAAKLVANITLPQMVKVMSTLAQRKRRSISLLRTLSYNITASLDQLNLKQSGDLLYSMSVLNFIDQNLLSKISNDICQGLHKDIKKSSVVGSIITSFGLLKYKNPEVLDALSDWILKNHALCRPQDIFSLFVTLASLNYIPANSEHLFETLIPQLTQSEARTPLAWLNIVWSLVLLNQAPSEYISSVLSEDFLEKVEGNNEFSISTKLKLLNIDAAAEHLVKNYQGIRLQSTSSIHNVTIFRPKEKVELVEAVIDTLRNLIKSESYLQTNLNSGAGFIIDAKCLLDKKCHPVLINKSNESRNDVVRIAFLIYDYHDMCKRKIEPTGINAFASRILEAQGYKVLEIPYTDFRLKDKLVHRVKYVESKLKDIVK